jgi:hypothetical protein
LTVTVCVAAAPVAPSLSVAAALTVEVFVPSGKTHLNDPDVFVNASELATLEPLTPQVVVTAVTVSAPGSLIE